MLSSIRYVTQFRRKKKEKKEELVEVAQRGFDLKQANIFHGCSIGFRRMIAISMKLYFFTANEYVIHKGDLGTEMFFVTQGRIDIYATEDLKRPTASLIEGAHFGK
jgi:CRP-like cAMP-binding protein